MLNGVPTPRLVFKERLHKSFDSSILTDGHIALNVLESQCYHQMVDLLEYPLRFDKSSHNSSL